MKLDKILLFLFMSLFFVACSDDEDTQKHEEPEFTKEDFCADWYSIDKSGLSATSLTITKSYSLQRIIYANPNTDNSVIDEASGTWVFYPNNSILRLEALSKNTGYKTDEDYKVLSISKYEMSLRDVVSGYVQIFHKLLGTVSLTEGDNLNLTTIDALEGIDMKSFMSYNPAVAKVSQEGVVTSVASGETYIEIGTENGAFVIKISNANNVQIHVSELGRNFNDVVARYGEPSKVADLGNGIIGNLFNNPTVEPIAKSIQINYDKETLKVTRVLVAYSDNKNGWNKDYDFIRKTYIYSDWSDENTVYYCDTESTKASSFFITPFEKDGKYYITYANSQYAFSHGGNF